MQVKNVPGSLWLIRIEEKPDRYMANLMCGLCIMKNFELSHTGAKYRLYRPIAIYIKLFTTLNPRSLIFCYIVNQYNLWCFHYIHNYQNNSINVYLIVVIYNGSITFPLYCCYIIYIIAITHDLNVYL